MADEVDEANELAEAFRDGLVLQAQRAAREIPKGCPGECQACGEQSPRLVDATCAPCRDSL